MCFWSIHCTNRSQDDASWEEILARSRSTLQFPIRKCRSSTVEYQRCVDLFHLQDLYNNAPKKRGRTWFFGRSHLIRRILPVCGAATRNNPATSACSGNKIFGQVRSCTRHPGRHFSCQFQPQFHHQGGTSSSTTQNLALFWYCRFLEDLLKIKVYAEYVDCRFPVETECIWIQDSRFALRYVGLTWPLFVIGYQYVFAW